MTVKNDITAHIDAAIAAMTTASYNYTYNTVNTYKYDDKTYPNCKTTYQIVNPEETIMNMKYTGMINARFIIELDDTEDVDLFASKVLEDIQKMMYTEQNALRQKGMLTNRHGGHEIIYSLNKLRPGRIEIPWEINFRVSMSNPSST